MASFAALPLLPFSIPPLLSFRRRSSVFLASATSPELCSAGTDAFVVSTAAAEKPTVLYGFSEDSTLNGLAGALQRRKEISWTLSELIETSKLTPVSIHGDVNTPITGIQIDSRCVTSGDLFICCVGKKTDGHRFVSEALSKGATAVVACKNLNFDDLPGCGALVIVNDSNAVLASLAASFYRNPSTMMSVVGITGTNGKTTTAHLVKGIYESMGMKTGMFGTVGYFINGEDQSEVKNTTPDAVTAQRLMAKMLENGTEALIMEISSHGLALGRCDEIEFNVAVFTNLTRDHFDFHGTEEEYRNSKLKLFVKMSDPKKHRKVVNVDDPNAPFFIAKGNADVPVVTFGMESKEADVFPLRIEVSMFGTWVLISTPKGIVEVSSRLLGRHNVYNILAAVAVGVAVNCRLEDVVRGIEMVSGVPGRCELIDEHQPFAVMVDFAHTPDALARVLDSARELGARRLITVFGCAGESDTGKRPIMTKIAADKSDVVILTTDNPKTENPLNILNDMLAGVGWTLQSYVQFGKNNYYPPLPNGHELFVHARRRVAVRAAMAMADKGDIVVVAGRGHEKYQEEGDRKRYIDDREECREALHYVEMLHRAAIGKQIPLLITQESLISFCKDVETWFAMEDQRSPCMLPIF
ncbi:UDP-N-acetylmuramoylalanyl-D-glutamate-2,6-diaminopimelate ligase protein [Dioscorea alata]|uniref:UDP-N-acetylmuramoylalanyl-D-glutamate-2, 6-diaminopimelate ligase protein n=1 Tax=Dioscorea alata TaxID=55571 RepID=A0ACB7V836_DIOAL|nr:UDP-N-acetylmuramoylalanyl-D-glutamate-2,6-diaminopimelate ligase protein [Dioscorea alata]